MRISDELDRYLMASITQSASIFIAVQRRYLCSNRWFQRRYRPWLNSYQRTDYLNGVFNRPVGDKLVRPLFFCGVKSTGFRSQLGVLLPNICQLIPSAVLLAKNKRLANKDYLLLSTIKHLSGGVMLA